VHIRLGRAYFEMPIIIGLFVATVYWMLWLCAVIAWIILWWPLKLLWLAGRWLILTSRGPQTPKSAPTLP
jgi:hypothetical protein